MRRIRVHLEVDLDVDDDILKDNNEPLSDEQVAKSIYVTVTEGSSLSCADEAIEIVGTKAREFYRIPLKKSLTLRGR